MGTAIPTKRIPAIERRAEIARAAGPLFGRHGYAGTRLEDIAAAAGVTKPIVYRHFDSKKDLYMALLRKHRDDMPGFLAGIDPADGTVSNEAVLRAVLEAWLDYVRENHHSWLMLFRDASGDEEIRDFRRDVSLRAREVMAMFIERLGPGVPAEQVRPTAELLTSGLAGLALWWGDHPETPKPVLVEAALRVTAPAMSG